MFEFKYFWKRPAIIFAGLFLFGSALFAELPRLKVGDKVPNFTLKDRNGVSYSLEQFRGNVVFVNFWATWCPPCVKELPSMESLNQYLKAKNFVMIAVSVDESWAEVDEFFKSRMKSPSFLILRDPDKNVAEKLFGCTGWPETYIVSPKGELLRKDEGDVNWTNPKIVSQIEKWLKIK